MEFRVGFLFVVVLGICWVSFCDGRNLLPSDPSDEASSTLVSDFPVPGDDVEDLEEVVCALCQRFTSQALNYLASNKTQTEIILLLHNTCSQVWPMKAKCMALVDYYAPLFFTEVSTMKPGTFCQDVDLCTRTSPTSSSPSFFQFLRSCEFCHSTVAEAAVKLKDPDRQVAIMESLLKGCDAVVGSYVTKCKKMVWEYGPLVLTNAEIYLEATDICNTFHACHVPTITATTTHQDGLHLLSNP